MSDYAVVTPAPVWPPEGTRVLSADLRGRVPAPRGSGVVDSWAPTLGAEWLRRREGHVGRLPRRVDAALRAEYGADVSSSAGVAAYARALSRGRPLSRVEYVRMVRRRHPWAREIDGRLIAPLWRRDDRPFIPPREWGPGGRAEEWLAYWRAAAARPEVVGSEFNPDPDQAARAWALGVPAELAGAPCARWPSRWAGNRERILLLQALARKGAPGQASTLGRLRTADLRRIAKLSGAAIRAGVVWVGVDSDEVDWTKTAERLRRFSALPQSTLRAAGIPARAWFDWTTLSPEQRAWVGVCAEAFQLTGWPDGWRKLSPRLYEGYSGEARIDVPVPDVLPEWRAWAVLIKHGRMAWAHGLLGALDDPLMVDLANALTDGWKIPVGVTTRALLREALDADGHASAPDTEQPRDSKLRALDRLAQRNPEWAIQGWSYEYQRGKRIAPVLKQVLAHLRARVFAGEKLVILGRDGELIHHLLQRVGLPSSYMLASRALTTQTKSPRAGFLSMVDRILGGERRVTFVDTGFAGSIPAWFKRRGVSCDWTLVASTDPAHAMPIAYSGDLRDLVLADLEHAAQRLETVHDWTTLQYSAAAPGYWARLYGVCDALGLPRGVRS